MLYFSLQCWKKAKQYFDALCSTDFRGKIIQGAVDYLSRHPSVDYAMKTSVVLAAILMICGVALECLYLLRLIYWMVVNFFISALIFGAGMVFVLICSICSCLHAILKFMLATRIFFLNCYFFIILGAILSGVVFIYLLRVWGFHVSKRLFISKRNDAKQKPGTSKTATADFPVSPLTPLNSSSPTLPESMPYSWQFKEADSYQWSNFGPSDNVAIEQLYCDVENLQVKIVLKDSHPSRGLDASSTTVTVNFEQMSMQLDTSAQFLLRRLSTPSYVQEPDNALSTKWVWYWKDNDGWKKYAKTKKSTGTKQEDIEAAYLNEERIYFFQIGTSKYTITFRHETSMYQRNMDQRYLTTRSVRRRPLFASQPVPQTIQSDLAGRDMDFERIALGCDSQEF